MITKVDKSATITIKLSWEELEKLHEQLRNILARCSMGDVLLVREFLTDLYQARK